jgi:hypothetical protein
MKKPQQQQQQQGISFKYKEKGLRGIVPRAAEEVLQAVNEKKMKGIDASVNL